jgi:hypothetical protein
MALARPLLAPSLLVVVASLGVGLSWTLDGKATQMGPMVHVIPNTC